MLGIPNSDQLSAMVKAAQDHLDSTETKTFEDANALVQKILNAASTVEDKTFSDISVLTDKLLVPIEKLISLLERLDGASIVIKLADKA